MRVRPVSLVAGGTEGTSSCQADPKESEGAGLHTFRVFSQTHQSDEGTREARTVVHLKLSSGQKTSGMEQIIPPLIVRAWRQCK